MNIGSMMGLDQKNQLQFQEDVQKYVNKATKLIHSKETREDVKNKLKGGSPMESIANVSAGILGRIDHASRYKGGYEAHDAAKLEAGYEIVKLVAEVAEAAGIAPPMSEDEITATYAVATEKYLAGEIEAGRIDPDKLRAEMAQGMQGLNPDQQKQIDEQTIKIGQIATGGNKT